MKSRLINDRNIVLDWMKENCYGFRKSRFRKDIIPHIGIPDRRFRQVISALKHEGHIASTHKRGYWFIPPVSTDREEVAAAAQSWKEMRSRAMSLLQNCDQHLRDLSVRQQVPQGQAELFG